MEKETQYLKEKRKNGNGENVVWKVGDYNAANH